YQQFLGRPGEASEIDSWVKTMEGGASEEDVVAGILASDEYRGRFGSNDDFVIQLYQDVLGRTPASAEVAIYTGKLNGGDSRESIVESIVTSPEARIVQLNDMYRTQLLRTPGDKELKSYTDRFGDRAFITDVGIEIAASDEMVSIGGALFPAPTA